MSGLCYPHHINFGGTLDFSPPGDHANPIHRCNAWPLREALVGIQGKRNCWSHGDSLRFRHTIRFRSWRDTGLGFRRKTRGSSEQGESTFVILSGSLACIIFQIAQRDLYESHGVTLPKTIQNRGNYGNFQLCWLEKVVHSNPWVWIRVINSPRPILPLEIHILTGLLRNWGCSLPRQELSQEGPFTLFCDLADELVDGLISSNRITR